MTFTDDDLERVKFAMTTMYLPVMNPKVIEALIARLETAERVAIMAEECLKNASWDGEENIEVASVFLHGLFEKLPTWRKTAGK
jgi:hypothetical protein